MTTQPIMSIEMVARDELAVVDCWCLEDVLRDDGLRGALDRGEVSRLEIYSGTERIAKLPILT